MKDIEPGSFRRKSVMFPMKPQRITSADSIHEERQFQAFRCLSKPWLMGWLKSASCWNSHNAISTVFSGQINSLEYVDSPHMLRSVFPILIQYDHITKWLSRPWRNNLETTFCVEQNASKCGDSWRIQLAQLYFESDAYSKITCARITINNEEASVMSAFIKLGDIFVRFRVVLQHFPLLQESFTISLRSFTKNLSCNERVIKNELDKILCTKKTAALLFLQNS